MIKIINFIRGKALNRRLFKKQLISENAKVHDLIFHCEIRWLSKSSILKRFYELKDQILKFVKDKEDFASFLKDVEWTLNLAFLVDIHEHLNELNIKLQGKNNKINSLYSNIKAFKAKLKIWMQQLKEKNRTHSPALKQYELTKMQTQRFLTCLESLYEEFDSRFSDLNNFEKELHLFASPFIVNVQEYDAIDQMELIELQNDDFLKGKFVSSNLEDFYKLDDIKVKSARLYEHALYCNSMFGSTYICEQLFSKMKLLKSRFRTKLSDENLEATLRIATTVFKANIESLVENMKNKESN